MSSQDANTLKILVASDIHIGYAEKDPVRGNDSFNSFEEVLQIAKAQAVDMILLGGDLFHDNKPSPKCLIRCTELLRKYCLGDDPVQFQLLSDQKENFKHTTVFPYVNFEEENLNVALPVFTIHGNHDDPTGKNPVYYLEALSASGLINYFGKYVNMTEISVRPLLLQKGKTKLALYGLGSVPEERLHRFFLHKKIKFLKPEENRREWYNLLVVHQNRVPHGTKYLPEKFLGKFPDLVVWGHEHESKPLLEYNTETEFHVLQPGSTVATSLCPGEAAPKHIALLEIVCDDQTGLPKLSHEAIPLKSVRQFYFETMDLDEELENRNINPTAELVEDFCTKRIQSLIDRAEIDHSGDPLQPKLPLIRLRIEYSKALPFSVFQFGLKFKGKVANPNELLLFKLKRKVKSKSSGVEFDQDKMDSLLDDGDGNVRINIEDIVDELLSDPSGKTKPLDLLSERKLTKAVRDMVEKEADNLESTIEDMVNQTRKVMYSNEDLTGDNKEAFEEAIREYRNKQRAKDQTEKRQVVDGLSQHSSSAASSSPATQRSRNGHDASDSDSNMQVDDDDDDDIEEVIVDSDEEEKRRARIKATRGRGAGRRRN
jgi:double-strand break repair protein MRE11